MLSLLMVPDVDSLVAIDVVPGKVEMLWDELGRSARGMKGASVGPRCASSWKTTRTWPCCRYNRGVKKKEMTKRQGKRERDLASLPTI